MQSMSGKNTITKQVVMENCILTMEIFCKDNLKMADVKAKEDGLNLTEAIMKGTSKIMLLTDMENILISTDISLKVNGKIIFQMARERHSILMEADIMANFSTIKGMVKVS